MSHTKCYFFVDSSLFNIPIDTFLIASSTMFLNDGELNSLSHRILVMLDYNSTNSEGVSVDGIHCMAIHCNP